MLLADFKTFLVKIIPQISEETAKAFSEKAQLRTFAKGEHFVKAGEVCRHLLFIHKGLFRYYLLHEGNAITKDFAIDVQNPFCTAYSSFMQQKPSEIWIEALEPSQVWIWKRADVIDLFESHLLWSRFAKAMADRLIFRKDQREILLLKSSAAERYQSFLADFPGVSQRIPQYYIASYLGITPESLSRIRAKNS